jgi:hypothetical protein
MRQALMMELKSAGEDLPELRQIARRVIDCALHDEENWSWAVSLGSPRWQASTDRRGEH